MLYAGQLGKIIWGDKTPNYLLYLPLLKTLFPKAKFVHIIRDVRDYCLSINAAWQKNPYRAAQRWHDSIKKCRKDGKTLPQGDYMEINYEALIDDPAHANVQAALHQLHVAPHYGQGGQKQVRGVDYDVLAPFYLQ